MQLSALILAISHWWCSYAVLLSPHDLLHQSSASALNMLQHAINCSRSMLCINPQPSIYQLSVSNFTFSLLSHSTFISSPHPHAPWLTSNVNGEWRRRWGLHEGQAIIATILDENEFWCWGDEDTPPLPIAMTAVGIMNVDWAHIPLMRGD